MSRKKFETVADLEKSYGFLWACFRGCYGKISHIENERAYVQATIPKKGNCDAESKLQVNECILESYMRHGQESEPSCHCEKSALKVNTGDDRLECSDFKFADGTQLGNSVLANNTSPTTSNKKERDRDRWKAKRLSIYQDKLHIIPTHSNKAPQAVHNNLHVEPSRANNPVTSRLVPIPPSAARAGSAGRTAWTWLLADQGAKPSSFRVTPPPDAPTNIWLVPVSSASRLA
jgi:hypothetical protein